MTPFIDWKPRPDIQLSLQVQNITERGYRDTRRVFAGPRNLAGLALVDDRDQQFGRIFYARIRKYFGG